jgi:Zn-finger nucleic acid-binding protein
MRCAACNAVLDSAKIAAGDTRCACGADLDLPGDPRRASPPVEAPPTPKGLDEPRDYRTAPAATAAQGPSIELANVGAELRCPRCKESLSYAFQGSYDVHECHRCFGAFVEVGALATFVDEARTRGAVDVGNERSSAPHADVSLDALARCPSCNVLMLRRVFGKRSGVLVDVCADHGTWFDAGELAKALAFEAGGGAARVEKQEYDETRAKEATTARARAQADASLLQEQVREARAVGRWQALFEGRGGFLDWLGRTR